MTALREILNFSQKFFMIPPFFLFQKTLCLKINILVSLILLETFLQTLAKTRIVSKIRQKIISSPYEKLWLTVNFLWSPRLGLKSLFCWSRPDLPEQKLFVSYLAATLHYRTSLLRFRFHHTFVTILARLQLFQPHRVTRKKIIILSWSNLGHIFNIF